MNTAPIQLIVSVVIVLVSLPLILRKVKMNGFYGIRIPESFRSEERWYQINRFGGILFLLWGVTLGVCGGIGVTLPSSQWAKYNLVSAGIIVGGLVLLTTAIFIYAARTKKD